MLTYNAKDESWRIDARPPICPRCRKHIAAIAEGKASESGTTGLECIFSCPSCRKYFIGVYEIPYSSSVYELRYSLPASHTPREFPRLKQISGSFETLYNQSASAETNGLNEIAGIGYRKALEFLIKDYCIALKPAQAAEVRKLFLGSVIKDFVDDGKLKRAATLTSWLGNDEGHYERRWVDKDLTDLKALLELTVSFAEEEVQLELYTRSMQPNEPHHLHLIGE